MLEQALILEDTFEGWYNCYNTYKKGTVLTVLDGEDEVIWGNPFLADNDITFYDGSLPTAIVICDETKTVHDLIEAFLSSWERVVKKTEKDAEKSKQSLYITIGRLAHSQIGLD